MTARLFVPMTRRRAGKNRVRDRDEASSTHVDQSVAVVETTSVCHDHQVPTTAWTTATHSYNDRAPPAQQQSVTSGLFEVAEISNIRAEVRRGGG